MDKPIVLKTNNLTKIYVMGRHKAARKAKKAIKKLHKKYENLSEEGQIAELKKTEEILKKAQNLFADEKYQESYKIITGKELKIRKKPRGVVIHALNGIDIEIKKGDLISIMGPSGSGKSTFLNMLGLLDEPTAGQIFLNEKNITSISKKIFPIIRSKKFGFVFQAYNLIPTLTAQENVMLPLKYSGVSKKERREKAIEALSKVGLEDRINHTPNELSGGQKQRVAIARSLVNNPMIIFGDELTGELDSKTTCEIMNLVIDLNKKGQTFIIVTHNPEVAKMCHKTIIIKDGKLEKINNNTVPLSTNFSTETPPLQEA